LAESVQFAVYVWLGFDRDPLAKKIMQIAERIFVPNLSVCGCDSIFTL
jgi:hypothetical protein